jgi:FkbM family methyltransferase
MLSTAAKIRIARLIYLFVRTGRRLSGLGDEVRVRRRGIQWRLDLREGIDLTIYLAGAFERSTLAALEDLVRPGMNVVDVGANIGAHTLHLARLVGKEGAVAAFEPTDFAFAKLRANLADNPEVAGRVTAHQSFLVRGSSAPVQPKLASSWPVDGRRPDDQALGSMGMLTTGARAERLDDALAGRHRPIDVMKMDVDGHEHEVLGGAGDILKKDRPTIVMELAPYVYGDSRDFEAVLGTLWGLDYDLIPLKGGRPLPRDVDLVRRAIPAQGSVNVIARPVPSQRSDK